MSANVLAHVGFKRVYAKMCGFVCLCVCVCVLCVCACFACKKPEAYPVFYQDVAYVFVANLYQATLLPSCSVRTCVRKHRNECIHNAFCIFICFMFFVFVCVCVSWCVSVPVCLCMFILRSICNLLPVLCLFVVCGYIIQPCLCTAHVAWVTPSSLFMWELPRLHHQTVPRCEPWGLNPCAVTCSGS
jgi:hypothetical protein